MALTKVKASNITLTTAAASSNDTTPATTAYVTTALANLVDSAPGTLNTLNELAAALGDDANFSTTVTNSIATKAPLASPSLTGTVTVTGASGAYNTLQLTSNSTSHGTIINLLMGHSIIVLLKIICLWNREMASGMDLIHMKLRWKKYFYFIVHVKMYTL